MSTRKPESEFHGSWRYTNRSGKIHDGYESTIAFGEMHLDLPEEERRYALRLLVNKYSSAFKEIGEKYIEKSFYRTNILRLDISHISGKCKRLSQ